MAQFSVEITRLPGSVLGGNQQCCRIFHEGLPDTQTELVELMQDWIMDDPNWGEPPDPSTIRKKVKVVWQRLKPE